MQGFRFELITLGDELLLGLTANGHLTFIGAQLGRRRAEHERCRLAPELAHPVAAKFLVYLTKKCIVGHEDP